MTTKVFATAITLFLLLLSGSMATAQAQPQDDGRTVDTPSGPLTGADRDLLVKVKQAGLWEMPMGEEAQKRASSQRVKQVGKQLMLDHMKLDEATNKLAAQLGVPLPELASADQQSWMAELTSKTGPEFDRAFADRLRAAHGKVFVTVAKVRSQTRNDAIRPFAQIAVDIVMKHMTLLESTGEVGDVGFSDPVAAGGIRNAASSTTDGPNLLVVAMICAAGAATTLAVLRILRPRRAVR